MDPDLALLARLVGDVDRFAEVRWGRASTLRASGTSFDDLLTIDEVERLLGSAARRPTFRLVQDGVTLPPERSTRSTRLAGAVLEDVADLARIAEAVDGGATLVLQGLQRTSSALAQCCRSLERATSHPVQANAYLTPAGAAGLKRHSDDHDVVVLQVLGSKSWSVEDLGPVVTRAGDVLYMPAGTPHEATAQDGVSLHLTLGLLRVTDAQVVRRLLDGVVGLDRPLPLGYARPDRAEALVTHLRDTLAATSDALAAADADVLAAGEIRRARARRLPLPSGQLRSVLALDDLGADDTVGRRPDHAASIDTEGAGVDRFLLRLVDRTLDLPVGALAAVEQLLREPSVGIGDLADLEPNGQLVLARRLIREGLLVVNP